MRYHHAAAVTDVGGRMLGCEERSEGKGYFFDILRHLKVALILDYVKQ